MQHLLLSLERLPSDELIMTQELIANMLGVRREGVTETAGNLQRAGLIQYSRGHIKVIDRAGLKARVCECYAVAKKRSSSVVAGKKPLWCLCVRHRTDYSSAWPHDKSSLTGYWIRITMSHINAICAFTDFGADPVYFSNQLGVKKP